MIRIGIICPSEIAFRRFLPALKKCQGYSYVGVAVAEKSEWFGDSAETVSNVQFEKIRDSEMKKAQKFQEDFGGKIFRDYSSLICSSDIDAVYLPLPPALHFKWAKFALEHGKHVLVEKPSTCSRGETEQLVRLAEENSLALHENYMFVFHKQLESIDNLISSGEIGDVRLFRVDFGFPRRAANDFRYSKNLGGGALLDCGGYTLKYASMLLGGDAEIEYAHMGYTDEFEVDLFGSAALSNKKGQIIQIGFGMDNAYKCTLEAWGSEGRLISERVLTAPAGFVPSYQIIKGNKSEIHELPEDDTFFKSLEYFQQCIYEPQIRKESYQKIIGQARLVDKFRQMSTKSKIITDD